MSFWELVRVLKKIGHEPVAPQKSGAHFLKNWARVTDTIPVNLSFLTPSRKRLAGLSLIRIYATGRRSIGGSGEVRLCRPADGI